MKNSSQRLEEILVKLQLNKEVESTIDKECSNKKRRNNSLKYGCKA